MIKANLRSYTLQRRKVPRRKAPSFFLGLRPPHAPILQCWSHSWSSSTPDSTLDWGVRGPGTLFMIGVPFCGGPWRFIYDVLRLQGARTDWWVFIDVVLPRLRVPKIRRTINIAYSCSCKAQNMGFHWKMRFSLVFSWKVFKKTWVFRRNSWKTLQKPCVFVKDV